MVRILRRRSHSRWRDATGVAVFDVTYDANGNHIRTLWCDTGDST
jgi:hypothetical protein